MASDSEASCVNDPNFAVICSFLDKFGEICGVSYPSFSDLQAMLENVQEVPLPLIDLHVRLLRKTKKSVSLERWEKAVAKFGHTYSNQDGWELERFGYKKAKLSVKLRLLKNLLEKQFDSNARFKSIINKHMADDLRVKPMGRDKLGQSYWYQVDGACNLRIYREDQDEETWDLVAKDREGLIRLINQLSSSEPGRRLSDTLDEEGNDDSNSQDMIEKPLIDTGQVSDEGGGEESEGDEEDEEEECENKASPHVDEQTGTGKDASEGEMAIESAGKESVSGETVKDPAPDSSDKNAEIDKPQQEVESTKPKPTDIPPEETKEKKPVDTPMECDVSLVEKSVKTKSREASPEKIKVIDPPQVKEETQDKLKETGPETIQQEKSKVKEEEGKEKEKEMERPVEHIQEEKSTVKAVVPKDEVQSEKVSTDQKLPEPQGKQESMPCALEPKREILKLAKSPTPAADKAGKLDVIMEHIRGGSSSSLVAFRKEKERLLPEARVGEKEYVMRKEQVDCPQKKEQKKDKLDRVVLQLSEHRMKGKALEKSPEPRAEKPLPLTIPIVPESKPKQSSVSPPAATAVKLTPKRDGVIPEQTMALDLSVPHHSGPALTIPRYPLGEQHLGPGGSGRHDIHETVQRLLEAKAAQAMKREGGEAFGPFLQKKTKWDLTSPLPSSSEAVLAQARHFGALPKANIPSGSVVGEAIEEPVVFVRGEGSGEDCEGGNTGKDEDTAEKKVVVAPPTTEPAQGGAVNGGAEDSENSVEEVGGDNDNREDVSSVGDEKNSEEEAEPSQTNSSNGPNVVSVSVIKCTSNIGVSSSSESHVSGSIAEEDVVVSSQRTSGVDSSSASTIVPVSSSSDATCHASSVSSSFSENKEDSSAELCALESTSAPSLPEESQEDDGDNPIESVGGIDTSDSSSGATGVISETQFTDVSSTQQEGHSKRKDDAAALEPVETRSSEIPPEEKGESSQANLENPDTNEPDRPSPTTSTNASEPVEEEDPRRESAEEVQECEITAGSGDQSTPAAPVEDLGTDEISSADSCVDKEVPRRNSRDDLDSTVEESGSSRLLESSEQNETLQNVGMLEKVPEADSTKMEVERSASSSKEEIDMSTTSDEAVAKESEMVQEGMNVDGEASKELFRADSSNVQPESLVAAESDSPSQPSDVENLSEMVQSKSDGDDETGEEAAIESKMEVEPDQSSSTEAKIDDDNPEIQTSIPSAAKDEKCPTKEDDSSVGGSDLVPKIRETEADSIVNRKCEEKNEEEKRAPREDSSGPPSESKEKDVCGDQESVNNAPATLEKVQQKEEKSEESTEASLHESTSRVECQEKAGKSFTDEEEKDNANVVTVDLPKETPLKELSKEIKVMDSGEKHSEKTPPKELSKEIKVLDSGEKHSEKIPPKELSTKIKVLDSGEKHSGKIPPKELSEEIKVLDSDEKHLEEISPKELSQEAKILDSGEKSSEEIPPKKLSKKINVLDSVEKTPSKELSKEIKVLDSAEKHPEKTAPKELSEEIKVLDSDEKHLEKTPPKELSKEINVLDSAEKHSEEPSPKELSKQIKVVDSAESSSKILPKELSKEIKVLDSSEETPPKENKVLDSGEKHSEEISPKELSQDIKVFDSTEKNLEETVDPKDTIAKPIDEPPLKLVDKADFSGSREPSEKEHVATKEPISKVKNVETFENKGKSHSVGKECVVENTKMFSKEIIEKKHDIRKKDDQEESEDQIKTPKLCEKKREEKDDAELEKIEPELRISEVKQPKMCTKAVEEPNTKSLDKTIDPVRKEVAINCKENTVHTVEAKSKAVNEEETLKHRGEILEKAVDQAATSKSSDEIPKKKQDASLKNSGDILEKTGDKTSKDSGRVKKDAIEEIAEAIGETREALASAQEELKLEMGLEGVQKIKVEMANNSNIFKVGGKSLLPKEDEVIAQVANANGSKMEMELLGINSFKMDEPMELKLPKPRATRRRSRKDVTDGEPPVKRVTRRSVEQTSEEKHVNEEETNKKSRAREESLDLLSEDLEPKDNSDTEPPAFHPRRGGRGGRRGRGRGRGGWRGRGRGGWRGRGARKETEQREPREHTREEDEVVVVTPPSSVSASGGRRRGRGRGRPPVEQVEAGRAASPPPMRQSRRIALIRKKEEEERRKTEEEHFKMLKEESLKKTKKPIVEEVEEIEDEELEETKKKKKKRRKLVVLQESEEEFEVPEVQIKKKKKNKRKKKKRSKGANPWESSGSSTTSEEVEEEEEEYQEEDDGELVFKSDHEFSPESDLGEDEEYQPTKRARTAKKEITEGEEAPPEDDKPCQKCGQLDHPEWILLCDKCDAGWHALCLRPALMVVPEGNWFCPPCEHSRLLDCLHENLRELDRMRKRKDNQEMRRKRLAYVGISLDNILPQQESKPEKGQSESDSEGSQSPSQSQSTEEDSSEESDEPIYQLRARRQSQNFSYRFQEYDQLIDSAIQDELDGVKGAGNQGKGKDIENIVNAEREEKRAAAVAAAFETPQVLGEGEEEKQEVLESKEDAKAEETVGQNGEQTEEQEPGQEDEQQQQKEEEEEEEEEEDAFSNRKIVKRKRTRKLTQLDVSSGDDTESDEDFKGSSSGNEEEEMDDDEDFSPDESDDSDLGVKRSRAKRRAAAVPVRRSARTCNSRFKSDDFEDSEESDEPHKKRRKRSWDSESESELSDETWGKRKKKTSFSWAKKSSGRRQKKLRIGSDSDEEVVKSRREKKSKKKGSGSKKRRIKFGMDVETPARRTRGCKVNYREMEDSNDSEEHGWKKKKKKESEDEYNANEDEDQDEEDKEAVEDPDEDDEGWAPQAGSSSSSQVPKESVTSQKKEAEKPPSSSKSGMKRVIAPPVESEEEELEELDKDLLEDMMGSSEKGEEEEEEEEADDKKVVEEAAKPASAGSPLPSFPPQVPLADKSSSSAAPVSPMRPFSNSPSSGGSSPLTRPPFSLSPMQPPPYSTPPPPPPPPPYAIRGPAPPATAPAVSSLPSLLQSNSGSRSSSGSGSPPVFHSRPNPSSPYAHVGSPSGGRMLVNSPQSSPKDVAYFPPVRVGVSTPASSPRPPPDSQPVPPHVRTYAPPPPPPYATPPPPPTHSFTYQPQAQPQQQYPFVDQYAGGEREEDEATEKVVGGDDEHEGEFGGLVSYFSSQQQDDMDS